MSTFRFSPILDETRLHQAIRHIHLACHELCLQSLRSYLPVAGNIGIFSQSADEYETLIKLQKTLTDTSKNVYGKYYKLYSPIVLEAQEKIPATTYTYLYIRKPDVSKPQVGDLDFFLEPKAYTELKEYVKGGSVAGARLLPNRPDLDLIELYNPEIDALGYIGDKQWT